MNDHIHDRARLDRHIHDGWIGVDLDGTVAHYDRWCGPTHIGAPIPAMVERIKQWLKEGRDVRIFTARMWPLGTIHAGEPRNADRVDDALKAVVAIQQWCKVVFGKVLPITCCKDFSMIVLYDDRAKQVIQNTGELLEDRVA